MNKKSSRWQLVDNGAIAWKVGHGENLPFNDHFAMSGFQVDIILEWSIDQAGRFATEKVVRWPMLRTIPDDTRGCLERKFSDEIWPEILIDDELMINAKVEKVEICGTLAVDISYQSKVALKRIVFTSVHSAAIIDYHQITNNSKQYVSVEIPSWQISENTPVAQGVFGSYTIRHFITNAGKYQLAPGESVEYSYISNAFNKEDTGYYGSGKIELIARQEFGKQLQRKLILKTPEPVLNRLFEFSKIRASESIFATRGGLMHSPGGYNRYLAAIWANDQAEYINPFFPFLGQAAGNQSAINSFEMFAKYINPNFEPIPSSIVAEGRDVCRPAGDRGDMAMLAYGATRFALAFGDKSTGQELWPLISWCLEYSELQKNEAGVIASDSDELEYRFECGNANLCTSCLHYDSLISASYLAHDLGKSVDMINRYLAQADTLRQSIAQHFEAEVEGYQTYQYFAGNDVLRSWICIPLTVDIFDRLEGTADALFSDRLWTHDGLLTEAGTQTIWDRSTLYGFRGLLRAGKVEPTIQKLIEFSEMRLLGDHVPYVVEADPEFNRSHLSAESGLYCRIFIEGLFGIRPTGLNKFTAKPTLPKDWPSMTLEGVAAFGMNWNICVKNAGNQKQQVIVSDMAGAVIYNKILKSDDFHTISLDLQLKKNNEKRTKYESRSTSQRIR